MDILLKTCTKCREEKELSSFNRDKGRKDGFSSWCKECFSQRCKVWYINNKERAIGRARRWQEANAERLKHRSQKYRSRRMATDVNFKLSSILRSRLAMAIRNGQKTGSAVKDLGCSMDELKVYLESKFLPGMSWDNYGRRGWHIDHVVPLSKFNLSDPEQLKKACHYTNLQPLWAHDNLSKNKR